MDCYFRQYWRDKRLSFKVVYKKITKCLANHLMVENHSMLEGAEEELKQPCDQPVEPQREDAGENLEARHIFPQWTQLLPAHNHQVNFFQDRLCSQIIFPLWLI